MPAGGAFLIEEPGEIFIPERFTAEQRQVAELARDYLAREVRPRLEAIESPDFDLTVRLVKQAGALGMLGAELPERYGGLGLDLATGALLTETVAPGGGFALTVGAHTGIGTLPIALFGSEAQRARWLPLLASGEKIAAYALTEPASGSDALAARTVATAAGDGTYRLTGTKQFITNAGFADVFVVYAKIDGERFSAFIVERGQPGVSLGPEERKMGLHGSSTRQLRLDGAVGELLGEAGRGHVIAFNILNIGRFKLGAGCLGSSKHALGLAAAYASERVQFGRPIASYGLVQEKLAAMNTRIFALESMVYRTAALMDARLGEGGDRAAAVAEYALECSINKVYGSEGLDLVVDEAVQIHGGNGFIRGYEVERLYRDARINRIFEGTNEINRLLIPDQLLRRAMTGRLPLLQAAESAQREVASGTVPADPLAAAKRTFLMLAGAAALKFGQALAEQQELLRVAADAVIDIYAAESARARAAQTGSPLQAAMAALVVEEACARIEAGAREAMTFLYEGDARHTALAALRRLGRREPPEAIALRRRVAGAVLAAGGYAAG